MARVPLIDPDDNPDLAEIAARIKGRRRGRIINVYRTLLHSPPLAESWFEHINRVRWGTELSGRLREIIIVRLGHLLQSAYILRQHVPNLAKADGVSRAECDALADWQSSGFFDAAERAALAYADGVAAGGAVAEAVFAPLRVHYTDRQIVELTVMIGAYISHARVLGALEVDLETDT